MMESMEKIRRFISDYRYILLGALCGDLLLLAILRPLGIHPDLRHLLVQVAINVLWVGAMVLLERRDRTIG